MQHSGIFVGEYVKRARVLAGQLERVIQSMNLQFSSPLMGITASMGCYICWQFGLLTILALEKVPILKNKVVYFILVTNIQLKKIWCSNYKCDLDSFKYCFFSYILGIGICQQAGLCEPLGPYSMLPFYACNLLWAALLKIRQWIHVTNKEHMSRLSCG